ncbi:MAG: diadenylate cyclase CdaA [Rhabdochlamydiaceae bacterium]
MLTIFHSLTPFMEILIISLMINYILSFLWNTRSMDLILGLMAFLFIYAVSTLLDFPILNKIMYFVANVAAIAIVVIFQPELRVALSKLSLKTIREKELSNFEKFLEQLTMCAYRLSEKRIGALIVIENKHMLTEFSQKGIILNSQFSVELMESIFQPYSPLHDGAVILRDELILAAAVILPLAEDTMELTRDMGTRHRAALGISQISDALIIVVSEETGKVSIAREGIISRGIKIDRFKGIIRSVFNQVQNKPSLAFFKFWKKNKA